MALMLLIACGPTASISLNLSTGSVLVFLGGSEDVEVTLTRSADATADVTLSASGAPAWVTVTFAPATLSGATLTSTMTVATDGSHPDAEPLAFDLTVSAVGPGVGASKQLAVVVEQLNVNGTVVNGAGEPLAGLTVHIPGHVATVSGADGTFMLDNVVAPYDLTVADPVSNVAHTFVGLTMADPVLQPLGALLGSSLEFSTNVTGSLVHATLVPIPTQHAATVCIEGIDRAVQFGCGSVVAAASSFSLFGQWAGAASTSVRLRAVIYEVDADGEPTAIVAAGTSGAFTLTDGIVGNQDVTVTSTSSQAVVATTTSVPPGYTHTGRQLIAHHSDFASISLGGSAGAALTRDVIAPFFVGGDYSLFVTAQSNVPSSGSVTIAWSAGLASGDSVSLSLPRPAVQVSPPDVATGITEATEFTVVNPDGGVVTHVFGPAGSGTTYVVTTAGTTASIPDLATIGLALPATSDYSWVALTLHDVTTMDAVATEGGYLTQFLLLSNSSSGAGPGPQANGRISTSHTRTFTTQ